jgi:hypothetical protein
MTDDPRAENCDARDLRRSNDERFYKKNHPIICTFCTVYCECDHPTFHGFTIKVECFDHILTVEQLQYALKYWFDQEFGEIGVREGIDETWRLM